MNSRREFLRKVSLVTGGIGIWDQLPAAIQKAFSIDPDPGSTFYDAEHIVLLMQENRSFDHCFGTLQGVRGFNDPRAITLPGGNPVWLQSNKAGQTFAPFRLNIHDTKATWMSALPHAWEDQTDARNQGKYNGWLDAKEPGNKDYKHIPMTMGYYSRQDIPFYYALADSFTVCDQHFCASLTGTTANRSFFWTGKTRGNKSETARVRNSDLYFNREADWKTFPERLEEQGISWKVYQNEISLQTGLKDEDEEWLSNFTDNNLEWFSQYKVRFSTEHYSFLEKRVEQLPAEIAELEQLLKKPDEKNAGSLEKKLNQKKEQLSRFREELYTWSPANFAKLTEFEKGLHRRAFTTNRNDPDYRETMLFTYDDAGTTRSTRLPKGDILHQFRKDVSNGQLPAVSWLVAPQNFSDHPSAPWYGAWYVSEVLDILTQNPDVWKKTVFILTYDENDGYFDHMPPFVAPKPGEPGHGKVSAGIDTTEEYVTLQEELNRKAFKKENAREGPVGLGYRVPLVIASPWTRGGWVNSEVCDITSVLQFLEKFLSAKTGKAIKETNISDWRRTICGDLTSAFRPFNGEKISLPPFIDQKTLVKELHQAQFRQLPTDFKAFSPGEIAQVRSNSAATSLLPKQEPGTRHSCPLPYELYVDGNLAADKKRFEVEFHASDRLFGAHTAGSPFNVYAPGNYAVYHEGKLQGYEPVKAWAYAVRAGDKISDHWALHDFEHGAYHLRVYGPNGFFREFLGTKADPEIRVTLEYERQKNNPQQLTGNVLLLLKNLSNKTHTVDIADRVYNKGVRTVLLKKQGATIIETFNLESSFNWYDISVKVRGMGHFEKKYAGRVETGEYGKTDPFMGRVV